MEENLYNWNNWNSWRDVVRWCNRNGYKRLADRLDLNNQCDQIAICDALRYSETEKEAHEVAQELELESREDMSLDYWALA